MKLHTLCGLTIEVTEMATDRMPCRHRNGVTLEAHAEFEQYICDTCKERLSYNHVVAIYRREGNV